MSKENSTTETTTVATVMPFPYFGKKTNVAPQVWGLLGDVQRYIEPFCGACAVLLNRPHDYTRRYETINDKDAHLTNLLRAIKYAPEELGGTVNRMPVSRIELIAANNDVRRNEETLRDKLIERGDFYSLNDAATYYTILCDSIHAGKPGLRRTDETHHRLAYRNTLDKIFTQLSHRFQHVCIHSSSWETLLTPAQLRSPTGVYLDPPYDKTERVYRQRNRVSADVEAWCLEQTGGPHRIVLSGYDSEHDTLLDHGWRKVETLKATSAGGALSNNTNTEQLWYTPNCIHPTEETLF